MTRKPVLIDIDDDRIPDPGAAPAVPDAANEEDVAPVAMQRAVQLTAGRSSPVFWLFWAAFGSLLALWLSSAIWDFVAAMIDRTPVLGYVAVGLCVLVCLGVVIAIFREAAFYFRMARIDQLQEDARACLASPDLECARNVTRHLERLYAKREDVLWGRARLFDEAREELDPETLLSLAERRLLTPLDKQAQNEVIVAARQVATVTALVPLAFADVAAALVTNLRMIRRIGEIYGGRTGRMGTWRLTRSVMAHLVATGAVAVGDDMLSTFAGGGLLSKLSRRFGEGLVNGALTARVGLAAIDVCRPLPFHAEPRPAVTKIITAALSGLFKTETGRSKTN